MNPITAITHLSLHMNIRRREGAFRYATSLVRSLPDVIIIGAQKSGTTSIFKYLSQHPNIEVGAPKEVHYFDNYYQYGDLWYRSHFPIKSSSCVLEASPNYLFFPYAAQRIHQLMPKVKLVAILRNPTERAISHYYHQVRGNAEKLPLLEALQAEEERISPLLQNLIEDETAISRDLRRYSYKKRGIYIDQLEVYWKYFDPKNLLILNYEEFCQQPEKVLEKIYSFVGVEPNNSELDMSRYNVGANKKEASPEVYQYLDEFFKPHNERLYSRLNQDFGW